MFREGVRDCVPLAIGIAAWGLVAGVAMAKSGMGIPLAILMSVLVSAGSSQVAALPLIASDAPMWVVWATVACVNLRFLVFSYQYRPYFAHLPRAGASSSATSWATPSSPSSCAAFPSPGARRAGGLLLGRQLVNYGCWQLAVITGIVAGNAIPPNGASASPAPWRCWRSPAASCAAARPGSPRWSPAAPRWPPMPCPCG
jgi:predicted branched-subunit amino acid permease